MLEGDKRDQERPGADTGATAEETAAALEVIHARRRIAPPDVTSEQIRAEVQAQRERWRAEAAQRSQERFVEHDAWQHFWNGALVGGGIAAVFAFLAAFAFFGPKQAPRVRDLQPAVLSPATITPTPDGAQDTSAGSALMPPNSSLQPLSSIPDKTPFGCSFRTADQILSDVEPSQIMVSDEERYKTYDEQGKTGFNPDVPPNVRSSWTAVKYGGKVYLRGWVVHRLPTAPKATQTLHIFNASDVPELGDHPVRITLAMPPLNYQGLFMRIDNPLFSPPFESKSRQPLYQRLTQGIVASGFHLDAHAWEKWP